MATPTASALRFAALDGGPVALERLRSDSEAALRRALAATGATECALVLSHRLTTLLTHVFPNGLSALSAVAQCVELTDELSKVRCSTVVYVVQAQLQDVRAVATHAGLLRSVEPKEWTFVLLVIGKWTALCADVLDHQHMSDAFQVEQVDIGFVPLDRDLVTLGRERCLYDCYVQCNKSVLVDVASALHQLQRLYGPFDSIKYKGDLSAFVFQQFMEQGAQYRPHSRTEEGAEGKKRKYMRLKQRGTTHTLLLLDRNIDLVSVLSTPLTFEALIDELHESRDGFATVPLSQVVDNGHEVKEHVLPLNSSEPVFQRVRGLHIQAVSSALNSEASAVKTKFDRFRATTATASTAEVHEFVKTVPEMKSKQESLEKLVSLVEAVELATSSREFRDQWQLERAILDLDPDTDLDWIFAEIEDMIFRHSPLVNVLRALSLYSISHDGLQRNRLVQFKQRLLQTYGHELIFSFENLERLGLLKEAQSLDDSVLSNLLPTPSVSAFQEIATNLRAIDVDVDPLNPKGMAFVTSGYAPISCLLVEELLKHDNWDALDTPLSRLDGPRAEVKMKTRAKGRVGAPTIETDENENSAVSTISSRVLVVCFIGGVTYSEIAALRWLAQFYPSHNLVIASTSIINGESFLQDILERIPSTT